MPYNYGDDLAALWNEATSTFPNAQFIMMTHDGPYGSSTAQNSYLSEGKVIHCGSKDLTNLLLKEQNRIVFNLHGHVHDGSFTQNLGNWEKPMHVINPGPLQDSSFAEIDLKREVDGKWIVSGLKKHYL